MKKILLTLTLGISFLSYSQVIIGDQTGTASDKSSVLLEFANTGDKGIILPYVKTLPSTPTEGTLILDASTPTTARVKYYNGSWVDLSGQDADITNALAIQPSVAEETNSKAIIGSNSSTADGVLVLESSTKAMVLPIVPNVGAVPRPSPGMMVYISGPNKRLAVYNGNKWSYWKP